MNAPLVIIQARMASTRLPGKMLLTLNGETLIARAIRMASATFGADNVVVAVPKDDAESPLAFAIRKAGAKLFVHGGEEADLLGRFYACAHHYRWHPQSVIVRWTPDDPWKDPETCRAVANGGRHPVELGCEAFTLAQLDYAYHKVTQQDAREHLTYALFPFLPPPPPDDGLPWTIDTEAEYNMVRHLILSGVETAEDRLARGRLSA